MYTYYILYCSIISRNLLLFYRSVVQRKECIGIMYFIGLLNRCHSVFRVTGIEGNMYWYYVLYWFIVMHFCKILRFIRVNCIMYWYCIMYCMGPLYCFLYFFLQFRGIGARVYWYYVMYCSTKKFSYSLKITSSEGKTYWYYVLYWFTVMPFL